MPDPDPTQPQDPLFPQEQEIADRLRAFRPRPGLRFYRRMNRAPWRSASPRRTGRLTDLIFRRTPLALTLGVVSLLALVFLVAQPGVQAVAQRLADFFIWYDSDRTEIQVTADSLGELDTTFDMSISEAGALAGFPAHVPAAMPPGIEVAGAAFLPNSHSIILDYHTRGSNQILRLSQSLGEGIESYAQVGSSAQVQPVHIAGNPGEYVSGGWRAPIMAGSLQSTGPGMIVTLEAQWDPDAMVQILRWQSGGRIYELLQVGASPPQESDLSRDDLIAIAETITP